VLALLAFISAMASPAPSLAAAVASNGPALNWPSKSIGSPSQPGNSLNANRGGTWLAAAGSAAANQLQPPAHSTTAFLQVANGALPIYSNAAFCFYPDRMEACDAYAGIYRSSNGISISKDGDASYCWTNARLDRLYLQTPYPILDATFALAVSSLFSAYAPPGTTSAMLAGTSPGSVYYTPYFYLTHGADIREYTRDSAQYVQWGDAVILDPATVLGTLTRRFDFAHNVIREDYVVTADSIHLISAVWEYFKITGNTGFLSTCWPCLWNTMTNKEHTYLDASDGLWRGGPWSDNVSGFVTTNEFNNRLTQVKSLYCNLLAAMAWRDLGQVASTLGYTAQAAQCGQKSAALKSAINAKLYRPELRTYCYYEYVPSNTFYNYREDISAGLLLLSGVADAQQCLDYHAGMVVTPYGYRNVDPVLPSRATSYHGGNVWENEEGFHGWALARLGEANALAPFIFWHARAGLPFKKWQEGTIDPSNGRFHTNYTRLSWGAMGYTSYWTRGLFGILYDPAGFSFQPCVPPSFGNNFYAVLDNFTYRNSNLRINLTGCGTHLSQILLDGAKVSTIPATLSGPHNIRILMANAGQQAVPPPR